MEKPTISVIVPCYNVEKYLDECVSSIICQTYSNLEIILVDDGSPDRIPQMCDEWAKRDHRIRVVHKKNGGLADARNAGLDICTGEFVAFVDSDDFIEPNMYESLFCLQRETGADICCGCTNKFVNGQKLYKKKKILEDKTFFTGSELLSLTLSERAGYASWDKIYKRDIIGHSRFPKGRNNEDILFLIEVYQKCTMVVYTKEALYNYRYTPGSITSGVKVLVDYYNNMCDIEKWIDGNGGIYKKDFNIFKEQCLLMMVLNKKRIKATHNPELDHIYTSSRDIYRKKPWRVILHRPISLKEKILILCNLYF